MALMIDEKNLKEGLLGLVVALVQIIQEALEHQALRRMEGGDLSQEEVERLGEALYQLDIALAKIIEDNGIEEGVASVREGLDDVASDFLDRLVNPSRWEEHGR
ncbi:MAG: gas vesicle protein K [Methanotrichaceae archaeon]|nr:gas vesicle protein K [Methanotrichaceae archaeon]